MSQKNSCGGRQFYVLVCNILANLLQIPIEFVFVESKHDINPQYHSNAYVYFTSLFLVFWSGLSGVNLSHRGWSGGFIFVPQCNDTLCLHYHVLLLYWCRPCIARKILTRVHLTNVYLSAFCFPTQLNCVVRWSTIVPKHKVKSWQQTVSEHTGWRSGGCSAQWILSSATRFLLCLCGVSCVVTGNGQTILMRF